MHVVLLAESSVHVHCHGADSKREVPATLKDKGPSSGSSGSSRLSSTPSIFLYKGVLRCSRRSPLGLVGSNRDRRLKLQRERLKAGMAGEGAAGAAASVDRPLSPRIATPSYFKLGRFCSPSPSSPPGGLRPIGEMRT